MSAFDTKGYRAVLKETARGAWADDIKTVRQDLDRDPSSKSFYKLDLPYLFGIPQPFTNEGLKAWKRSLELALNKSSNANAANIKQLLEALSSRYGDKLVTASFWQNFAKEQKKLGREKLEIYLSQIASEYPLGVVFQSELTERLKAARITDVSQTDVVDLASNRGLEVSANISLPENGLPSSLRAVWKAVSGQGGYNTFVHTVRSHTRSQVQNIRVLDSFTESGKEITTDDIGRSLQLVETLQDTDTNAKLRKFLIRLKEDVNSTEQLRIFTIQAILEKINQQRKQGRPLVAIRDNLVKDDIADSDASRLVAAASITDSGPALTDSDAILEALAQGDLPKAIHLVETLDGTEDENFGEAKKRVADARQRKDTHLAEYEAARSTKDYARAAQALKAAQEIDADDDSLQQRLDQLPPPPVAQLHAYPRSGNEVALSWPALNDDEATYTVTRINRDERVSPEEIAQRVTGDSFTDRNAPLGVNIAYSIVAQRRGHLTSAPTESGTVLLAPPPTNIESQSTDTSVSVSWTRAPGSSATIVSISGPRDFGQTRELNQETSVTFQNLTAGATYSISVTAIYRRGSSEVTSVAQTREATPRREASAITDLAFAVVRDESGKEMLRTRWTVPHGYNSEIWRFARSTALTEGRVIDSLESLGGSRFSPKSLSISNEGIHTALFPLPDEPVQLAPILFTDHGPLLGTSVFAGSAKPIESPVLDVLGNDLRISFAWPRGNADIDVQWKEDGVARTRSITNAEYRREGGVYLHGADRISDIRIVSVLVVDGSELRSSPVSINYSPVVRRAEVHYSVELKKSFFGGKYTCIIVATTQRPGLQANGHLLLKPGPIMPSSPTDGSKVSQLNFDFTTELENTYEIELGKLPSPFWVKVFTDDSSVDLHHPPTPQLKA